MPVRLWPGHGSAFQEAAACACHSLVVRLPTGGGAPGPRGATGALRRLSHPEGPDEAGALRRLVREAYRPLHPDREALRATLIGYPGGWHDLVLTASRARMSRAALEEYARAAAFGLPAPTGCGPEPVAGEAFVPGPAAAAVPWGCGDPSSKARGCVVFAVDAAVRATPRLLVAAVRLAVARFSAGTGLACEFPLEADETVGGWLERAAALVRPDGGGHALVALPPVAVLAVDGPGAIGDYRPFLGAAAPLVLGVGPGRCGAFTGRCSFRCDQVGPAVAARFCDLVVRAAAALGELPAGAGLGGVTVAAGGANPVPMPVLSLFRD